MVDQTVCSVCGLPLDLCVCKAIEREAKQVKVYVIDKKFKKPATIIEGIDEKSGKNISKELKRKLACGGTFKEGKIELQGNHKKKVKELLVKIGFDEEQIEVA